MGLDIRLPIGILFSLLGAMLLAYGLWSEPALYERSLGINVNLYWGGVMLMFGALMLAFAFMRKENVAEACDRHDSGTGNS